MSVNARVILNPILSIGVWGCRLGLLNWGYGPVASCCEHGKGTLEKLVLGENLLD